MLKFVYYYLRSMRLYYGFVTGTTTLVGCLASGHPLAEGRTRILFAMGFLAWGFNQIFSDWYDRTKDAVNAPHRPMVTGALKPAPAFAASPVCLRHFCCAAFGWVGATGCLPVSAVETQSMLNTAKLAGVHCFVDRHQSPLPLVSR